MRDLRQSIIFLMRHFFWLVGLALAFTAAPQQALAGAASIPAQVSVPGQISTRLPDGRWLLSGGAQAGNPVAALAVYDSISHKTTTLKSQLKLARAYHTATVLPDGRVLILGGLGLSNATLNNAELLDVATDTIEALSDTGLMPRSHHTATLLTDGKLLMVGGLSGRGETLTQAELWNPKTHRSEAFRASLYSGRYDHAARLLAANPVLVSGGVDHTGAQIAGAEQYQPLTQQFAQLSPAQLASTMSPDAAPAVAEIIPPQDSFDVQVDSTITVRFTTPLNPATLNAASVTLLDPNGQVVIKAVAAEAGMLLFVTPSQALLPGSQYTLFIQGGADDQARALGFFASAFKTASFYNGLATPGHDNSNASQTIPTDKTFGKFEGSSSQSVVGKTPQSSQSTPLAPRVLTDVDDDVFMPGPHNRDGRWRTDKPLPKGVRALLDFDEHIHDKIESQRAKQAKIEGRAVARSAVNAQTGMGGTILRLNDQPLAHVTVTINGTSTLTDGNGRFELTGVAAGKHEMIVDGSSANGGGRDYAQFAVQVEIKCPSQDLI